MIKIVSTIKKSRNSRTQPWIVSSAAVDHTTTESGLPYMNYIAGATDLEPDFTTALARAAEQRASLDAMLMDSVFADRLARREAKSA